MDVQKKTSFLYVVLCLNFMVTSFGEAQTFPQDMDYSNYTYALVDAGYIWDINSTFHPLSYRVQFNKQKLDLNYGSFNWISEYLNRYTSKCSFQNNSSDDGLYLMLFPGIGIAKQNGVATKYKPLAIQPFLWTEVVLRRNWYARSYLRATNVASSLPHFSGYSKGISRIGLNTAEFDQLLFGFRNDWAVIEFGRSREIWGPIAEENLLLAGTAPPWERLMIQITHRNFTYRWFYGYLETVFEEETNIQRYIIGKALQYNNRTNLVISLGEVISLAGPNRPIDFAFANPLGVALEIENNRKENDRSGNHQNTILFANFDWMPTSSIRTVISIAVDEFQIDRKDRNRGEDDALGYLGRIAWTPIRNPVGLTLFWYGIRNDTWFVQHSYGYTNLVNHGELISHPIGNDADEIAIGTRIVFKQSIMAELTYGQRRWGDNSLLENPYNGYERFPDGFYKGPFPSGQVRANRFLSISVDSQLLKGLSLSIDGHIDLGHSGEDSALEAWIFSARYQIPFLIANYSN